MHGPINVKNIFDPLESPYNCTVLPGHIFHPTLYNVKLPSPRNTNLQTWWYYCNTRGLFYMQCAVAGNNEGFPVPGWEHSYVKYSLSCRFSCVNSEPVNNRQFWESRFSVSVGIRILMFCGNVVGPCSTVWYPSITLKLITDILFPPSLKVRCSTYKQFH
jgi:hypothetical protein